MLKIFCPVSAIDVPCLCRPCLWFKHRMERLGAGSDSRAVQMLNFLAWFLPWICRCHRPFVVIQASHGFRKPHFGFQIPGLPQWIPDPPYVIRLLNRLANFGWHLTKAIFSLLDFFKVECAFNQQSGIVKRLDFSVNSINFEKLST